MGGRQRVKTVVLLEEARQQAAATPKAPSTPVVEENPLYGVVLMKTALELKRRRDGTVEEILRDVLARMRIPEPEFRAYLEQRGGELGAALGLRSK